MGDLDWGNAPQSCEILLCSHVLAKTAATSFDPIYLLPEKRVAYVVLRMTPNVLLGTFDEPVGSVGHARCPVICCRQSDAAKARAHKGSFRVLVKA